MHLCFTKNVIRTNYIKHTLANKGIDVWNNIPLQYIKKLDLFQFSKRK